MSYPEDLLHLGNAAFQAGDYRESRKHFLAARKGFVRAGLPERVRSCDFVLGIAWMAIRKWRHAVDAYERALAAWGDEIEIPRAECLWYAADCLEKLSRKREARGRLLSAAAIFRQLEEPLLAGRLSCGAGSSFMAHKLHLEAVEFFEEALEDFRSTDAREIEADTLVNLGACQRALRRLDLSAARYREARPIYLEIGQLDDAARAAFSIADVENDRGNYAGVLEMLDARGEYLAQHGSRSDINENDMMRAIMMGKLGHHEQALAMVRSLGVSDDVSQHDISGVYAELLHHAGRAEDAITAMRRVRDLQIIEGDAHSVAAANLSLGSAYDTAGMPGESLECFRAARDWFRDTGYEEERLQAELGMGMATKSEDARDSLERTLALEVASRDDARAKDDALLEAQAENLIGTTVGHLGDPDRAIVHYQRARTLYSDLGLREWAARLATNEAIAHYVLAATGDSDPATRSSHVRDGLSCALTAAIYLDAVRYSFASQSARREWSADINIAVSVAFQLAHEAGDARIIADLATFARSTGVMRPAPAAASSQADIGSSSWSAREQTGARVVMLLGAPDAALDPPPIVVMPGGGIALAAALELTCRTYNVELSRLRQPRTVELV